MFKIKVSKILMLTTFCVLLTSCSNMKYISKSSINGSSLSQRHDHYLSKKPKTFGAVSFSNHDKTSKNKDEESPTVFMLKRKKSTYMAETMLFDNSNDYKSIFKQSYISFGANHKKKHVGVNVRFVY